MSEPTPNQEGHTFSAEEVNDINSGVIAHLAKSLKEYPSLRELLSKGKVDILDPVRSLTTLNWDYTFARHEPELLQISIIKRPKSPQAVDSGIIEERVDIVYGKEPLIQHDITEQGKLKFPPEKNNPTAVKKTTAFISDLEAQI